MTTEHVNWHQTYPNIKHLTGKDHWALDPKNFYMSRVQEWMSFFTMYGIFPPGQVTADGMMVDGHHRLSAARNFNTGLWCVIVKAGKSEWSTTGEVAYVT